MREVGECTSEVRCKGRETDSVVGVVGGEGGIQHMGSKSGMKPGLFLFSL